MEFFKRYYLLICITLLIVGLGLEFYSSSMELTYSKHEIIKNGVIISKDVLSPNKLHPILKLISNLVLTLAISIFVSVFIIKKIDTYEAVKRERELELINKQINENIFDTLFETLVPKELYNIIKEKIIKSDIVRKNAIWIYNFSFQEDGNIILKQTLKSELHNVSNNQFQKDYTINFSSSREVNETYLERLSCEFKGTEIVSISKNDHEIGESGSYKIPLEIPPHEHADMTFIFITKYKNNEITDSYFSLTSLIGLTLIVRHPVNYKFSMFGGIANSLVETSHDNTDSAIYEYKGGILPNQGMSFSLKKMPDEEHGS